MESGYRHFNRKQGIQLSKAGQTGDRCESESHLINFEEFL